MAHIDLYDQLEAQKVLWRNWIFAKRRKSQWPWPIDRTSNSLDDNVPMC